DQKGRKKTPVDAAAPPTDASLPHAIISLCAGPEIATSPIIGLTPTTGALTPFNTARIPETARIGPMLVIGLLGQTIIALARSIASITPGAGSLMSAPAKRTPTTS